MAHSSRGWTTYTSTGAPWGTGVIFSIKCDPYTASNNGGAYTQVPSVTNFWPLHHGDLRFGYGKDGSGHKDSCVATNVGTPVSTIGGSWTDEFGNTYTTYGIRQERFLTSHLK